jgi:hypothetical protein
MSTVRRVAGQLLDHAFDVLPSLLLLALAFGTKRFVVEFAAAPLLATTRPPQKPPSVPSRPPARPKPVR